METQNKKVRISLSFCEFENLKKELFIVPRWSLARFALPRRPIRILPIRRQREHADSLRAEGKYGSIPSSLVASELSDAEFSVLCVLLLSAPREHPTFKQLRARTRLRDEAQRKAIESLIARKTLVRDFVQLDRLNRKEIYHITHPGFWEISFFRRSAYAEAIEDASIQPSEWIPRTFNSKCCPARINDADNALKEVGDYVEVPRILSKLVLPHFSKRLWIYVASLRETWHPTASQIAATLSASKSTVLSHLKKLQDSHMLVEKSYRHSRLAHLSKRPFILSVWHYGTSLKPRPLTRSQSTLSFIPLKLFSMLHRVQSGDTQGPIGRHTGSNRETHRVQSGDTG